MKVRAVFRQERAHFSTKRLCTEQEKGFLFGDILTSQEFQYDDDTRTSMRTQEVVVGNGPRFSKGFELVKPLAGDVELQEAGLHHVEKTRHPPTFLQSVLVALSVMGTNTQMIHC